MSLKTCSLSNITLLISVLYTTAFASSSSYIVSKMATGHWPLIKFYIRDRSVPLAMLSASVLVYFRLFNQCYLCFKSYLLSSTSRILLLRDEVHTVQD